MIFLERFIIGSTWDRTNRNGINKNFELLFGNEFIKELEGEVDEAIDRLNLIGFIPTILSNSGSSYPLINLKRDSTDYGITDAPKKTILDIQISGAQKGKIYQLSGIRNGLGGRYGIQVHSFDYPSDGNLDSATRVLEIDYSDAYTKISDKDSVIDVWVSGSGENDGIICTVVVDRTALSTNLNIAENELAGSQGAVVSPDKYTYGNNSVSLLDDVYDQNNVVYVDKGTDEATVYVPTTTDYVGYKLWRKTIPYNGEKNSNVDLWCVSRISKFKREPGTRNFTENGQVILYGPNPTAETIFKLQGEQDYSGGFYHGDENIVSYRFYAGGTDITNHEGKYKGENIVLMQETLIQKDSFTAKTDDTENYLRVHKYHKFDAKDGWTFKTRFETLIDIIPTFSNIGGFAFYRALEDGSGANWTDVIDLSNMKSKSVRTVDPQSTGSLWGDDDVMEYKVIGHYKDMMISFESDSPNFGTWFRNWAENEIKLYSKTLEHDTTVPAGTVVNSKVTYKLTYT